MRKFDLTKEIRNQLIQYTTKRLENYYGNTKQFDVLPGQNFKEIVSYVHDLDFDSPKHPIEAIDKVIDGLEKFTLHSPHPKCFGLYVPRPVFSGIIADLITAAINPQLGAWSHAPYAIEVERHVLHEFGLKFGYECEDIDGIFTSGGNEANLSAVLCALNDKYPEFSKLGFVGLKNQPVIYCSIEAHHSIVKAAKTTGMGYRSVRGIGVNDDLKMNLNLLRLAIEEDLALGKEPFMVIGTAGTTGAGAIDDLVSIRKIADKYKLWFHVDAAYGGAAVLNEDLKPVMEGIQFSDSITFDAHKWISMPMGIGMFVTSHPHILKKTFDVKTKYLPKEKADNLMPHPYGHSIQWSRRFMGLKLYLSLLFLGWEGFSEMVGSQAKMGHYLKEKLIQNDWLITNDTPLPVICFTDEEFISDEDFTKLVARNIVNSGKSWITTYPANGILSIRTSISNYSTTKNDVDELIEELNTERDRYRNKDEHIGNKPRMSPQLQPA